MEIPRAFEEVLDKSSVDFAALPNGCLQIVAEDTIDIPFVVFLPHEQEEGVAVLSNGGAEIHQLLLQVLVAGLHLGNLNGLTVGLWWHLVLFDTLLLRQVEDLHCNLDPWVFGRLLQYGPNPVGTEQNALFRCHRSAVEGVCNVEVDALRDVGHQKDLVEQNRISSLFSSGSSGAFMRE